MSIAQWLSYNRLSCGWIDHRAGRVPVPLGSYHLSSIASGTGRAAQAMSPTHSCPCGVLACLLGWLFFCISDQRVLVVNPSSLLTAFFFENRRSLLLFFSYIISSFFSFFFFFLPSGAINSSAFPVLVLSFSSWLRNVSLFFLLCFPPLFLSPLEYSSRLVNAQRLWKEGRKERNSRHGNKHTLCNEKSFLYSSYFKQHYFMYVTHL